MNDDPTRQNARRLLAYGHTDEDVERVSGLSLRQIIGLRAEAASCPQSTRRTVGLPYEGDRRSETL